MNIDFTNIDAHWPETSQLISNSVKVEIECKMFEIEGKKVEI